MVSVREQGFSTVDAAKCAGVTFRQLDYWDRQGTLCPSLGEARGSGSFRRYSALDVRIAAVLGSVTCCGMTQRQTGRLVETLRTELDAWAMSVIVTCDGDVVATDAPGELLARVGVGACWLINPAVAAAGVGLDQ